MEEDFDIREESMEPQGVEKDIERALRPLRFDDFRGQPDIVENLRVFVQAARMRGDSLDHTLLHGPPGLGKTTLSNIIANELHVGFKTTSGPILDKPGDLAGILMSLERQVVCSFYRRDPPSAPRCGGIPLLGNGGFSHRHTA